MRKILDLMTIVSFSGVLAVVIGGLYVYSNRDGLIEEAKRQVTEQVKGAVTDAVGNLGGGGGAAATRREGGGRLF